MGEPPEDEPGELVDGCLVEEEMPDLRHEIVVSWLDLDALWAETERLGPPALPEE